MAAKPRPVGDGLADPGDDPYNRLAHTVQAYATAPRDAMAVIATTGLFDKPTGLTHGDLRSLLIIAHLERYQRARRPAVVTIRTGGSPRQYDVARYDGLDCLALIAPRDPDDHRDPFWHSLYDLAPVAAADVIPYPED